MADIHEVTEANFGEISGKYSLLLLDFTATWCGPCKTLDPMLREIVGAIKNENFALGKVNVDNNQNLALQFDVMNVPAVVFLKNGELVDMLVNVPKKKDLETKISSFVS